MDLGNIVENAVCVAGFGAFAYCAYRLAKDYIISGAIKFNKEIKKDVDKSDYRIDGKENKK
jgi:hypothetical protein